MHSSLSLIINIDWGKSGDKYNCANIQLLFLSNSAILFTGTLLNDTAEEGTVRLMGGDTPLEGRVEIFLLGQWGTVCDYNWDLADATVVCHQLGYLIAVEAPTSATFGAGNGPVWYSNVRCAGTEQNLTECSRNNHYYSGSACPHSRDAGVTCSSEFCALQHYSSVEIIPASWFTLALWNQCHVLNEAQCNGEVICSSACILGYIIICVHISAEW